MTFLFLFVHSCYFPPQQHQMLRNLSYNGLKADVWSLGCVAYFLLCDTLPFSGPSTVRSLLKSL